MAPKRARTFGCGRALCCINQQDDDDMSTIPLNGGAGALQLAGGDAPKRSLSLPTDITAEVTPSEIPVVNDGLGRGVQSLWKTIHEIQAENLPKGGAEAVEQLMQAAKNLDAAIEGKPNILEPPKSIVDDKRPEKKKTESKAFIHNFEPALNNLVSIVWPRLGKFVRDLVQNDVQQEIDKNLPSMLKGSLKFTKVNLGQSWPTVGPLDINLDPDSKAIEVHVGIDLRSDLDVYFTALGMGVGITEIFFKGEFVFLLTPPSEKPPFFDGLQMFFANPPEINYSLSGAARLAHIPALKTAIRNAIDTVVAQFLVLPHCIAVDLNEDDDIDFVDMSHPLPLSILRFTLKSGKNLAAADSHLFSAATSDPYVIAALGTKQFKSDVCHQTVNPVWGAGQTYDFPVHSECQKLSLKVWAYEYSGDDMIGQATQLDVKQLVTKGGEDTVIPLVGKDGAEGGGSLTINTRLLKLAAHRPVVPPPPFAPPPGPSEAHLSVKVLTINGLPRGVQPPFKVKVSVLPETQSVALGGRRPQAGCFSFASKSKSGRSARGDKKKGNVLAEDCTKVSEPKPMKELQQQNQSICKALHEKGYEHEEIAEILDMCAKDEHLDQQPVSDNSTKSKFELKRSVTPKSLSEGILQVEYYLKNSSSDKEDKKRLKELKAQQQERTARRHPMFEDVVHLLIPPGAEKGSVHLTVLDKAQKEVAGGTVMLSDIIDAPGCMKEGPFGVYKLESESDPYRNENDKIAEVVGNMTWRWLHH